MNGLTVNWHVGEDDKDSDVERLYEIEIRPLPSPSGKPTVRCSNRWFALSENSRRLTPRSASPKVLVLTIAPFGAIKVRRLNVGISTKE